MVVGDGVLGKEVVEVWGGYGELVRDGGGVEGVGVVDKVVVE